MKKKSDPFKESIREVRSLFNRELSNGSFSKELYSGLDDLEKEENRRLKESLPLFRKKRLNSDTFKATLSILVKENNKITETDLDEESKDRLMKLSLSKDVPEGEGKVSEDLSYSFSEDKLMVQEKDRKYGFSFPDVLYACYLSLYCGYVFLEDGSVFYLEKDGEWLLKEKEILSDVFLQKGYMEKEDTSLVFLDGDDNYCRIKTNRIASIDDLFREEV